MGLKYKVSRASNAILQRFGARLERTDAPQTWQYEDLRARYDRNVIEIYQCLVATRFRHLPQVEGRQPLLCNLVGTNVSEAVWLLDALHRSMCVHGDVCEFGIAEGATSAFLANEIRTSPKKLWLFDSFEGLSRPTEEDQLIDDIFDLGSMDAYAGKMKYGVEDVIHRLIAINVPKEKVEIVPGFIEESLKCRHLPNRVCFAYVDFDFYQPILTTLHFLHLVLSVGGAVMIDDYGFFSSGAKKAVDEFHNHHRGDYRISVPPEWAGHFAVLQRVHSTST